MFVPHVAGVILWSDLQWPWLAERFDDAISTATLGQPVFREASAALAWATWACEQPGLEGLDFSVAHVRATPVSGVAGPIIRLDINPDDVAVALPIEPQPNYGRTPTTDAGLPPDAVVAEVFEGVVAEAERMWPRLDAEPWSLARGALVAAFAWSAGYRCAHRGTMTTVADRIARLASVLASAELAVEPSAAPGYLRLAAVASLDREWRDPLFRMPRTVLARANVAEALDVSAVSVPRVVAYEAFAAAIDAGARHGARRAGENIRHRWRDASPAAAWNGPRADDPVDREVARLVAATTRQVTIEWVSAQIQRSIAPAAVASHNFAAPWRAGRLGRPSDGEPRSGATFAAKLWGGAAGRILVVASSKASTAAALREGGHRQH